MNFPLRRVFLFALLLLGASLSGCVEPFDVPDMGTPDGQAFVRRCSLCHALPDPARMTYSKWEVVVERMGRNIRAQNVPQMPPEEREQILRYLKRHAKAESAAPGHAP